MTHYPFVCFSLNKAFVSIRTRTPPKLGAPQSGLSVDPKSYPWTHRDSDVKENKFGVMVADPYRWLEDPEGPRTAAFIESQNFFTADVLEKCVTRDKFKRLFTDMYNFPKFGCPHEEAGRYYFSLNSGLQNQSCIYLDKGDFKNPTLFLDPNAWSTDGTIALTNLSISSDGHLAAYSISSGGSDWRKIKVLRVKEQPVNHVCYDELNDELDFVKFSSISWTQDEKGFFYSRYADPGNSSNGTLGKENISNKFHQLYYHTVGTNQSTDRLVLKLENEPEYLLDAEVTEDGKYVIISAHPGCHPGNAIYYIDLSQLPKDEKGVLNFTDSASKIIKLVDNVDNAYSFIGNEGTRFTFRTDKDAPRKKMVQVDLKSPKEWKDIIPQHEKDVLQWGCVVKGDKMVVCYLKDCYSTLELRKFSTGELISEIDIPKFGSVTSFSGKKTQSEVFLGHQSIIMPPTVYRFNTESKELSVVHRTKIPGFNADDYETKQVFVGSYDERVKIPMFVTHEKGTELNGQNPTLLTGYGGFGISVVPRFSVSALSFVLAYGGIIASANIRGGDEYGLEWRKDGCLATKQNVFDDFQACSEYLIKNRYCESSRLAIRGGSNGGLLVAACANQRPDLYGCVVCEVGVLDMLRFHKFTIGHAWVPEFGDPDKLDDFEFLIKYSPQHNVLVPAGGTRQYPAIMLTTGDHDDRVSPLHTFKFVAQLQHTFCSGSESQQTNPIVARIETRAGHGGGKPTALIIDETADVMSFIAAALRAEWKLK